MIATRILLILLFSACISLPVSSLYAQSLNGGNTPLPAELQKHMDSPEYEQKKEDWIKNNPQQYQEMEAEAEANFVTPESNYPQPEASQIDNSDFPWYNYKGLTDIKAAKELFFVEKPEEYQQYVNQTLESSK